MLEGIGRPGTIARTGSISFVLFCIGFFLTTTAQVSYMGSDPRGMLLVSQSILENGTICLADYAQDIEDFSYRIKTIRGRPYHFFPLGPSLLATPFVAQAVDQGMDMRRGEDDRRLQKRLAGLTLGMVAILVFLLCHRFLPLAPAVTLALGVTFGTSIASTMGTAFWTTNSSVPSLLLALLLGLPEKSGGRSPFPRLAGVALFLAFLSRPTAATLIIPYFLVLLHMDPQGFLKTARVAFLLICGLCLFSLGEYGEILPPYYLPGRVGDASRFPTALLGNLVSPSRGFLVTSPGLVFILLLLLVRPRRTGPQAMLILGGTWLVFFITIVSSFPHWWGGHGFLGRLTTEGAIAIVLMALTPGLRQYWQKPRVLVLFILFSVPGIWMHSYQGLFNKHTQGWNTSPDVDRVPETLFDWQYPQFLANRERNWAMREKYDEPALHAPGEIQFLQGWMKEESWGRWATGPVSRFKLHHIELPATLEFEFCSGPNFENPPQLSIASEGNSGKHELAELALLPKPWRWQNCSLKIPGQGTQSITIQLEFISDQEDGKGEVKRTMAARGFKLAGAVAPP
jgi:hypothetical protein